MKSAFVETLHSWLVRAYPRSPACCSAVSNCNSVLNAIRVFLLRNTAVSHDIAFTSVLLSELPKSMFMRLTLS